MLLSNFSTRVWMLSEEMKNRQPTTTAIMAWRECSWGYGYVWVNIVLTLSILRASSKPTDCPIDPINNFLALVILRSLELLAPVQALSDKPTDATRPALKPIPKSWRQIGTYEEFNPNYDDNYKIIITLCTITSSSMNITLWSHRMFTEIY